ncbi:MAG: biotin/lipoyl-containing protein [Acidobacteriota bacterium]
MPGWTFDVEVQGRLEVLRLARDGNRACVEFCGRRIEVDVSENRPGQFSFIVQGRSLEVQVEREGDTFVATVAGRTVPVVLRDRRQYRRSHSSGGDSDGRVAVSAPMPGKVIQVLASSGQAVEENQGVLVVEAMKMQNEIRAPKKGVVRGIHVRVGQAVNARETLFFVE